MKYLSKQLFLTIFVSLISAMTYSAYAETNTSNKSNTRLQISKTSNNPPKVEIKINGLNDELKTNAMAYLELKKSMDNPHFSLAWLKKLHKKAHKNISDALHPFGYYHAIVTSTLKQNDDNSWLATYTVDKGKAVTINLINIVIIGPAKDDAEVIQYIDNFSIKTGDILVHETYEDAKSDLIMSIARMGYSKISTQQKKVIIDLKTNHAEIHLKFDSGIKYYLGEFNIHQDFLNDDFIMTYIQNIKPGDSHSKDKLLEIQDDLLSSGYFSKVDVQADYNKVNAEQQIPVDIFLQPSKRHKFSVGLGYDTQIETNLSLRWKNRRINRLGHNSDVTSKFSPKQSYIRGSYWIPTGNPHTDKYGIISKFESEDTDTTDRDTFDLQVGYWFEWQKWDSSLFTEYKYERFTIGNDPRQDTELLSLGFSAERFNYEKALFPRNGWEFTGQIRLASEELISDVSYARLYLKSQALFPIATNGRMNVRGELGMAATSDFDSYPSSLRFYAGGDQSVRGYKWKTLGPTDSNGEVTGGKNVFTASIEYDHKVAENWAVAGFVDTGNSYNDTLDKLFWGTGFGLRYISPIGLVRTDLGFPLTDDKDISTDNFIFYFGFEVTL